jgi:hypothetical protein
MTIREKYGPFETGTATVTTEERIHLTISDTTSETPFPGRARIEVSLDHLGLSRDENWKDKDR